MELFVQAGAEEEDSMSVVLNAVSEWQHWKTRLSWIQTPLEQYKEVAGKYSRPISFVLHICFCAAQLHSCGQC